MKIAVTSQNFRTVTGHAGRARRFLIYAIEQGREPAEAGRLDLPKELAMHDFHGDGPHPLDGIDVILTQGFGDGFARRMAGRGIAAATTDCADPLDAVKDYLARPRSGDRAAEATCGCGHGQGREHGHGNGHGHGHGYGETRHE